MPQFSKDRIDRLFDLLNEELNLKSVVGEIYLVGKAVMCAVFESRPSTHDIDAYFKPTSLLRDAAGRVARAEDISENWLNDGVKSFLSSEGDFFPYKELSNLKIFSAQPEYLLAMKALSFRIGEEFHDQEDVRYLLRYLNLETYEQAIEIIAKYYPLERFPQETHYALQEILKK